MSRLNLAARARSLGLLVVLGSSLLVAACGGSAPGGGGGGGGGAGGVDWDSVMSQIQATFGTTMTAGSYDAGNQTVDITLAEGSGSGMAKLFLCSNVKNILKAAGAPADQKVVIRDDKGVLSTQADCK
jgi:hypothetical protein